MIENVLKFNFSRFFFRNVYILFRIILAGVFIWAGITKLMDPKSFGQIISQYRIVPEMILPAVAVGLPLIELIAGIALVFDRPFSLSIITFLTVFFIIVLWFGILKNLDIDCGCFSASEQNYHDGLRAAFKRDLAFFFMAVCMYFYRIRNRFSFIF